MRLAEEADPYALADSTRVAEEPGRGVWSGLGAIPLGPRLRAKCGDG